MINTQGYNQEFWFVEWCEDLIAAGYIKRIEAGADIIPLTVFKGHNIYKTVTKKTRKKSKQVTLKQKILAPVTYKPDVIVYWADKAKDIFFQNFNEWKHTYFYAHPVGTDWITPVEVKAPFGSNTHTSDASFRILQKWIYGKFGILINRSVNYPGNFIRNKDKSFKRFKNPQPYLWMMTFTPDRYFYTDVKMDPRTISKWDPITLEQFLASKQLKSPTK